MENVRLRAELAERNIEAENLRTLLGEDRSALEMHQASMINLSDKDMLTINGRLLDRAELAESLLAKCREALHRIQCIDCGPDKPSASGLLVLAINIANDALALIDGKEKKP